MATVSFSNDTTAMITLKRGVNMLSYKLTIGTIVKNLQYETSNGVMNSISGKIVNLDRTNETITVADDQVIDLNLVYRLDNPPNTVVSINMEDLDVARSDEYMDETGEQVRLGTVKTNIVIGADAILDGSGYAPDPVIDEDNYIPIISNPRRPIRHDLIYDQHIQKVSFIQANMAATFREWFTSFFADNYFRHIRMKTESSFTKFKSFMKDIYHKEPPVLVIDPNTIEHVEDFLFGTNVVNRYNLVDPAHDNIGAKILYSLAMIETDKITLHYRRNRYKFNFDVMIMERSMNRALELYNYLIMNLRHNSKFMLFRKVANLLPTHMIQSIGTINGFHTLDDKFLEWLNAHAVGCSITTRTLPNGQVMFFAEQDCHIQVEVPSMPSHDSPEQSEAIEVGARVTDSFTFIVDLPSEYFCTMEHEVTDQYVRYQEGDDPDIHYITTSQDYKTEDGVENEIGDYTLFNRVAVTIQHEDDNRLNLLTVLHDIDPEIRKTAQMLLENPQNNLPSPLFKVRIIRNGEDYNDYSLNDNGILMINNPDYSKIYYIYVYLNYKYINMYASALNTEYIGDIKKTDY